MQYAPPKYLFRPMSKASEETVLGIAVTEGIQDNLNIVLADIELILRQGPSFLSPPQGKQTGRKG